MEQNTDYNQPLVPGNLKAAMKEAGATSRDLWYVPVDRLKIREGFNVRVKDAAYERHTRSIADSILANGFYPDEPLGVIVDGDEIVVHAGHCRFAGAMLAISEGAAISEVPCVSVPRGTSLEDLTVALHTTNSGKPLTPYELGIVCKRLTGFGWDSATIAKRLGLTVGYIDELLDLMAAPHELREMVQAGQLSAGNAIDLWRKKGADAVAAATSAVERANAEGKVKATAKHLDPEAKFSRAAKKIAVPMYDAIRDLRNDPGFLKINAETRQKIQDLLDEMDRVQ